MIEDQFIAVVEFLNLVFIDRCTHAAHVRRQRFTMHDQTSGEHSRAELPGFVVDHADTIDRQALLVHVPAAFFHLRNLLKGHPLTFPQAQLAQTSTHRAVQLNRGVALGPVEKVQLAEDTFVGDEGIFFFG